MDFNSSGYFAYKKNKIQNELKQERKPISRLSFLCQLFIATFIIMFIAIAITIMKYSSKMDIEYSKGELQFINSTLTNTNGYSAPYVDEDNHQRRIDKRLILIQQEENAPSEARIINKPKMQLEVIDSAHVEKNKKLEKIEKQEKLNKQNEEKNSKLSTIMEEVKLQKKIPVENNIESNVTVMSKVLLGRYSTFDEAQKMQKQIKANNPSMQPFVRKVGNVFSVQMGSYQDFSQAKIHAQKLSTKGLDVWIYQQ